MPLICECCGTKIEKYCVYRYSVEYLEHYLSEYFRTPFSAIMDFNNMKRKITNMRAICVKILVDFSLLNGSDITKQYKIPQSAVSRYVTDLKAFDHDYLYIRKDLANELPEVIKHEYQID